VLIERNLVPREVMSMRSTPELMIRRLNQATIATLDTPSVQQRLGAVAASVVAPERRSPEYPRDFVASEIEKWAVPIKASGAVVD
jgi:hypothetical protein